MSERWAAKSEKQPFERGPTTVVNHLPLFLNIYIDPKQDNLIGDQPHGSFLYNKIFTATRKKRLRQFERGTKPLWTNHLPLLLCLTSTPSLTFCFQVQDLQSSPNIQHNLQLYIMRCCDLKSRVQIPLSIFHASTSIPRNVAAIRNPNLEVGQ